MFGSKCDVCFDSKTLLFVRYISVQVQNNIRYPKRAHSNTNTLWFHLLRTEAASPSFLFGFVPFLKTETNQKQNKQKKTSQK